MVQSEMSTMICHDVFVDFFLKIAKNIFRVPYFHYYFLFAAAFKKVTLLLWKV